MKRFWRDVTVVGGEEGSGIQLDARPLKTPARETLSVPTRALADAIAEEWRECGDEIDPRTMPLTGLANAAIDHVGPRPEGFATDLARYAEADLLCYRAEHPPGLVAAQATAWDPLLAWARRRYDVEFVVATGIMHIPQSAATVDRLTAALAAASAFQLAALSPIVTIGGSLVTGLALLEQAVGLDTAWAAMSIDERWQIEQWGDDAEAVAALANRHADVNAAVCFLDLLN